MLKNDYPTPKRLIRKMLDKVQKGSFVNVLDPSAGRGGIIEFLKERSRYSHSRNFSNISAIEIDEEFQATLRGKGIKVIDSNFLTYAGPDKFDLIIANPPFDEGDKHLLKAIDIMYRGQIIFLLNAETLCNPYSNTRKELVKKLDELNAEIEYIQNGFEFAERKTKVEVALVNIIVTRNVEEDLFKDVSDTAGELKPGIETNHEVSNRRTIQELVAEYNQIVNIGIQTITDYYKNYKKVGVFIGLNKEPDKYCRDEDLTTQMQNEVNVLVIAVRKTFWRKTLDLKEVNSRMTAKRQSEFEHALNERCDMDFTEHNIRQFVLNLIGGYTDALTRAVLEIFDKFTIKNCYSGGLYEDNIHYFSGWKTNNAFKVGKKVIIPMYGGYGSGPFNDWFDGRWKLHYDAARELRDIDIVMNYFDGCAHYQTITSAITRAFDRGESRGIHSTYFKMNCYKKGTIHLTFRDEDILRRFNMAACLGKNWLPHDYGNKSYQNMNNEEQNIVDSFEGWESYSQNLNQPVFADRSTQIKLTHEVNLAPDIRHLCCSLTLG